MNGIYLVMNVQDKEEKVILDICSNETKARELQKKYIGNFRVNHYDDAEDIIDVEYLDLSEDEKDVIWSYDEP